MSSKYLPDRLLQQLQSRRSQNAFRILTAQNHLVDFCSNDYLGFSRSSELKKRVLQEYGKYPSQALGATGSRLISGNNSFIEELELHIAHYHKAEHGLIFNSGYDANIGLFSCLPQRNDTIIYDELVHASIRDGIRLSLAKSLSFQHNNLKQLEKKLKVAKGNIFVAVESVYSMDGDFAPLNELVLLCENYNANLIVDEAHATGIFGPKGEGKIAEMKLEKNVFARVHTFGKALGCHGAIILGPAILRDYLINYSRSFIYTTALPFHSYLMIKCAYDNLSNIDYNNFKINKLISLFKDKIKAIKRIQLIESNSPIQSIIIPGNDKVCALSNQILEAGFDVRPIRNPTVQKGKERLRICLHEFNTEKEVEDLAGVIKSIKS